VTKHGLSIKVMIEEIAWEELSWPVAIVMNKLINFGGSMKRTSLLISERLLALKKGSATHIFFHL